ncbi:MAG: hypothetical protein QXN53_08135 [Thermoproteota archaeon]
MRSNKFLALFLLLEIFSSLTVTSVFGGGEVTVLTRKDFLRKLIKEQEKDRINVTFEGKQYIIITLGNYINPDDLTVSSSPTTFKVYVDIEGNPIFNVDIARKIGVIDFAQEKVREVDLDKKIKVLEETSSTIISFTPVDITIGALKLGRLLRETPEAI